MIALVLEDIHAVTRCGSNIRTTLNVINSGLAKYNTFLTSTESVVGERKSENQIGRGSTLRSSERGGAGHGKVNVKRWPGIERGGWWVTACGWLLNLDTW